MKTVIKIAWRNVWRNRLRSGVVFGSIVMGVWAGLFVVALSMGMVEQQKRGAIETSISHLKIHDKDFLKEEEIFNHIQQDTLQLIMDYLEKDSRIKSVTNRAVLDATATTAHGFVNTKLVGINPETEKEVTTIFERVDEGTYFETEKKRPIVIGKALAEKLDLELHKSIDISFPDMNGNFPALGFKVVGIYGTSDKNFDLAHVFVEEDVLAKEAGTDGLTHEVAILCNDLNDAKAVVADLNKEFPSIQARPWTELNPMVGYYDEMMALSIYIILGIIILALTFGIINTMMMAVLERKRELGMLLCVGMNKRKVFTMIMAETIFLSLVAAPIGLLLAYGTISYFGANGMDLGMEEMMYQWGGDSIVYTTLETSVYINLTIMIFFAAVFSAISPARRALKYHPAEAVRAL